MPLGDHIRLDFNATFSNTHFPSFEYSQSKFEYFVSQKFEGQTFAMC